MNKSICVYTGAKNKRYLVKNQVSLTFFVSQSRLTDAVSVILSELLSYEHPAKAGALFCVVCGEDEGRAGNVLCLAGGFGKRTSCLGCFLGCFSGKGEGSSACCLMRKAAPSGLF